VSIARSSSATAGEHHCISRPTQFVECDPGPDLDIAEVRHPFVTEDLVYMCRGAAQPLATRRRPVAQQAVR
jgi:hypothetical protein